MLPAGRLRHRIQLEEKAVELDSDGRRTEVWVEALGGVTLPAEIEPMTGRELLAAAATQSKATTRIRVRALSGITPAMRARHRETLYNIEAVVADPESGGEWMRLLCSSGANEG
jgi:SPP1 family predicted phage head-tail adaptor